MATSPFVTEDKLIQLEDQRRMRKIIGEDLDWTLVIVPSLSTLCLQSIVVNFEGMLRFLSPYNLNRH